MAYNEKFGHLVPSSAPGAFVLTSTGVATPAYAVMVPCRISRIMATVTVLTSGTTAASLQFIYRPTYGSSSNQVTLGTLTIPTGASPGACYYKEISPSTEMKPGGQLVYNVSAAIASAGTVVAGQEVTDSPEVPGDISVMVASS